MYTRWIFSPALDCSISSVIEAEHPPLIPFELKPSYFLNGICDGAKQTESYKTILENVDEVHLNSNELWSKMINCFKIKGTIIWNQFPQTT